MIDSARLTISVIIPVYNGGEDFHQCLARLSQAQPPPDQVIVVADGDTDGSWRIAQDFGATVIRLPTAGGPAKARNLGAKAAQSDILFFIDADVAIYPDTIGQVVKIFNNEPNLTALIGSYDDAPGAANFLSQYKNLLHHYTHQTASEQASTFWGACGAIRRDIFLAMGGFEENYRQPCIEDIELGYRLKEKGYRIKLCKTLRVKHLKRWGIISLLRADFFYRALPWTAIILKVRDASPENCREFISDLNLKLSSRISVVLVYALLGALVTAYWWSSALIAIATCVFSLALLVLNRPVYQFFYQKRGLLFTIRTVPWHWLYYFYSGLAFAIGIVRHWFKKYLKPLIDLPNISGFNHY
ncbi:MULTISPECIES: glycosyltransferase [Moorena]|uniref:4,4'-diaponeurosporenoate glycosyltransferase n=1 Tax=Moorena producens PAL-8-15-08-1 TaxID=1458985 RepID=A0A1D8TRS1_9CYAN|nr:MULTISPECIES: glycosyltransferase [Moorena]AOX00340.1 glycosyl transferase [Moorena producens PAL-8-15-08-1]NEO12771.1 glycosyltransferase [Moorena sp. SIO3E8]NEP99546.1 glycosyltransferase [Moorena sp. SIO3F7]